MATIMLIFLVALGTAAMLGWTADTRDSADWRYDSPPEPPGPPDRHLYPEGAGSGPR